MGIDNSMRNDSTEYGTHEDAKRPVERLVKWRQVDKERWELLVPGRTVPAATAWNNGTWHTWTAEGIGHENGVEIGLLEAKMAASLYAIEQGFVSI